MPKCAIDDLASLIKCLQDAVEGAPGSQSISFGGDLFAAAGELVSYLDADAKALLIEQRDVGTPLVQPEPAASPVKVLIVGTAKPFTHGGKQIRYGVTISGTVPSPGKVELLLEAQPVEEWAFADNFPPFPEYLGTDGPALAWKASFYNGIAMGDPVFRISTTSADGYPLGLSFSADIDLTTGSLDVLKKAFPEDKVQVSGTIVMRGERFPLLALVGDLKDYSIDQVAELSLSLGTVDKSTPDGHDESTLFLVGSTQVGLMPKLFVRSPVLQGECAWLLEASVEDAEKYSLGNGLSELVKYAGGNQPLSLPTGLDMFASLHLAGVTVSISPEAKPSIQMIGFRVASKAGTQWTAPILGLAVSDFAIEWYVVSPFSKPSLIGSVSGTLRLGKELDAPRLLTRVDLTGLDSAFSPDVAVRAFLDPNYPLKINKLFEQFTGLDLGLDLQISDFRFAAETGPRTLQFTATLDGQWPTPLPSLFKFEELQFLFRYAPNGYSGSVLARATIAGFGFFASADYRGQGNGWLFAGGLRPDSQGKPLQDFVKAVAGKRYPDLPANLGAIELRRLLLSFETQSGTFSFDGIAGWPFKFDTFDLDIEAELSLVSTKQAKPDALEDQRQYTGFTRGTLMLNDFSVSVIYSFAIDQNKTLTFAIRYQNATLTCVFSKKKNTQGKEESILRANLGGVSFGDILEYLVNLVDPNLGFRLPAPWDVLYQLKFDNLSLEVNLDTKAVGATYQANADLGIARLDSISLLYVKRAGQSTVDIVITGDFLGTKYDDNNPLSWDLLNDPPPAPPGKGEQLLDLRYLGLGQSVAFRETKSFKKVRDVIDALEADFLTVDDSTNPLVSLPNLKFGGDGNWLIGADFTLMSAVSIAGVFNDPVLYGLRIGLAGPKVKSLAGLEFEILYKKISDTIGLYHIELTLPDVMRQLQFGAVSVTLPIVAIDIFTNGNFRLDFGFPVQRDFSRSFCVQAGPFIGFGGFYFALLDGATSEKVPAIRNGNFSPVIEFGLGLAIGLGRTIDKGVLSAGLTLAVEGIVEGVFGWFNPNDRSAPTDLYYHLQGTVGIVGKLYGKVDFVVIKASVNVVAYATVTLLLEAYEPIDVELEIGVEVSASLEIIFITVTFSFEMKLDLSFRIGDSGNAPWLPAGQDSKAPVFLLRQQRTRHRRRPLRPADIYRWLIDRTGEQAQFNWAPRRVFSTGPVDIELLLLPSLTPAIPSKTTSALRAGPAALTGEPGLQIVMALFVPTSTPSDALHAHEVRRIVHSAPADLPFNRLASGVFRWALASLRKQPGAWVYRSVAAQADEDSVTLADLDAIAQFLSDRKNRDEIFTYERVTALIEQNFVLRISNPIGPTGGFFDPRSDVPRGASAPLIQSAIFPMIPEVEMTPQGQEPVRFWKHACADQVYRDKLETYYDQLQPDPEAHAPKDPFAGKRRSPQPVNLTAPGPLRATPLPPGCADGTQPLSGILFCDYFGLLAQQSVQLAIDLLKAYPYEPTREDTLLNIAKAFGGFTVEYRTRPGDTLGMIAATFGLPVAEVRRTNAWLAGDYRDLLPHGSTVSFEAGPTVSKVAAANADYPLQAGSKMTVENVRYQVRNQQTLGQIAAAFAIADVGDLLTRDGAINNAGNPGLLRPGVPLAVPPFVYIVDADDMKDAQDAQEAFDRIAANFYTRSRQRRLTDQDQAHIDWYIAAISQNNPSFNGTLTVPVAELQEGQIVVTAGETKYTAKPSDTLIGVAAMFELLQLAPKDDDFRAFREKIETTLPIQPGTVLHLPGFNFTVQAGDTFKSIKETFFISPQPDGGAPLSALAQANRAADILQPRAVLLLPTISYVIGKNDTLASVAAQFNLALEELAHSAENDAAIFAPYQAGGPRMSIPDVASRGIDTLIADLVKFGEFNTLSTTVSRFLLNGMRAPAPAPNQPTGPTGLWGLYDVVGQQFPAPARMDAPYEIKFVKGSTAQWFCFEPPAGNRQTLGPQGCADQLVVKLPPDFINQHRPATTLDPMTVTGPVPMRLYDLVPPRYVIDRSIHWQTATEIALPGPTGASGSAGEPSLWLFPQTLLKQLAQGPTSVTAGTPPYELVVAQQTTRAGGSAKPISRYSWASAIPLRVTRARNDQGDLVPNAYEVIGADQDGRELLLKAWQYLEASHSPSDKLYLLYRPSVANDNSNGLVSDAVSAQRTFLLKTNLSTETHSNVLFAQAADSNGDFSAAITSVGVFLKFVWEASITGTGGFYLRYVNASDGSGLPDEIFASDATATIWAVLLLGSQSNRQNPARGLYPFNNCAVLAENLDASASSIAAQLKAPAANDFRRAASVPPGVIGFGLARCNPQAATGPTGLTQRLYSLVGYQVQENGDFNESHEGLPLAPLDQAPEWLGLSPTAHTYWSYQQTIPIAQFGNVNDCPESVVAAKDHNPYRGITGPSGPSGAFGRALSRARLGFACHDVYGNETVSTDPVNTIDVAVGYTDDLIGVGSWPGSAFDYLFQPVLATGMTGGVQLQTALSLQASRYVPGGGNSYEQAIRTASADAERYKQIFYQMQQHDVTFALESNIGTPQADGSDLKASATAFIIKAKLFADTAATLKEQAYTTTGEETLGGLVKALAITPGLFAAANKDVNAAKLFPGWYVGPNIVAAPAMNTLESLAKLIKGQSGTVPDCLSAPKSEASPISGGPGLRVVLPGETASSFRAAPLVRAKAGSANDVAIDNANAPLTPGITLRTKQRQAIPDFAKIANTLVDVAAALHCNVYTEVANPDDLGDPTPVGLLEENWGITDLLANGVVITIGNRSHKTDNDTFSSLFEFFNSDPKQPRFSKGDFAVAIGTVKGIFDEGSDKKGKRLGYADFIIPQPSPAGQPGPALPAISLKDLPPDVGSLGELAMLNRVVPNFFFGGSALLLGYSCLKAGEHDTLATLAEDNRITLEQLAFYNQNTKLGGKVEIAVPNLAHIPDPGVCRSAYSPKATDSLVDVGATFGLNPPDLAKENRYLPGIFRAGALVTIEGQSLAALPLDSLDSVYSNFVLQHFPALTFDDFINKIQGQVGIYRTNGAFVTALPTVPGSGEQTPPFEQLAESFNVTTAALLEANRSLYGFLRESATLNGPKATSLQIGKYDTIDTLIRRFRDEKNVSVTIAELIESNQGHDSLVTGGAKVLLPPTPTPFLVPFAPQIPPTGSTGEAAMIFPVSLSLKITRLKALVHPDFIDSPSVFLASTRLVPRIAADDPSRLTLDAFAEQFEEAFRDWRLKCAVTSGSGLGQADQNSSDGVGQLWAVNFGPQGVSRFSVDASSPKFYALRPLSTGLEPAGTIVFPQYVSGSGLCGTVAKRFDSVDLDAWMQQFLETVDLFLTPPFAVPAFQFGMTGTAGPRQVIPAVSPLTALHGTAHGPVGIDSSGPFRSPTLASLGFNAKGASGCTGGTEPNGPADYNRIVSAKQDIAKALRNNVLPIINAPGATGAYEWESARAALYQQMLVRLADAYRINAVVQFPVEVVSPMWTPPPGMTGANPPRVSGKFVPALYAIPEDSLLVPPVNSFAGVATALGVSAPYLAQVIGNLQGLLKLHAKLAPIDGENPVEVLPGDTLNSVAARLGIQTDPSTDGYWEQWVLFINKNAGSPLFVAKASFPLSRSERRVYSGDSLDAMSEFFARDVASVGRANQNLPGIIGTGHAVKIANYQNPYEVKQGDTLVQIAAGLSAANPEKPALTIDALSIAVRDKRDLLDPAITLRMVETLPEMSLSTAKVSLGRVSAVDEPNPALSFLLTVKHESERTKLLLNLEYAVNEVEYAIRNVVDAGNYQASSWLTLVLPLGSGRGIDAGTQTAIKQVQIPIPLRAYPPQSLLTAQSGQPSNPDTTNLMEARQWDYRFDVQTRKAAQDTDHIQVVFGEQQGLFAFNDTNEELFKWLAAFIDAYPTLMNDLSRLTIQKPGEQYPVAGFAVQALSLISEKIANSLKGFGITDFTGGEPADKYGYRMTTLTDGRSLKTLALDVELGPMGASAVWPSLLIKSTTAPTGGTGPDAGFLQMARDTGFYSYPDGFKADESQTYRFLFEKRDILQNSTGRGAIAVSRNDRLITQGPLGPSGPAGPVPTNEHFIYRTPYAEFVDPLIPLTDNDAPIDISLLSGPNPKPLCRHLLNMLASAIDVIPGGLKPGQYIEMLCSYGFPLTTVGQDSLIATTPILLVPSSQVSPSNVNTFAYQIASSLTPESGGSSAGKGLLVFQLLVFTKSESRMLGQPQTANGMPLQLTPRGATSMPLKPIFRLNNLQLPMSAIDWGMTGPAGCAPGLEKDER